MVNYGDESTDSATKEQLGVYVRYIDVAKDKIAESFLEITQIYGHPDTNNIFSCLMEVINPEDSEGSMPIDKLAGFTSDGASVMISPKEGALGKLRIAVTVNFFSTYCPSHLWVLASKEGQKELPSYIEKTLSDTPFYFRDSAVRRDEFKKLQEMVEPGNPHITIVQYHKVRWLCLWLIVFPEWQFFCQCLSDTLKNKQKIHETRQLYVLSAEICNRLSMPEFQFYVYTS